MVESPTRPWSSLSCFETTQSIKVVRVAVVAPVGNSNHSSLFAVIFMSQAVPNLFVSRKGILTHQVNWNTDWCNTVSALV